jgi:hypothetical protein
MVLNDALTDPTLSPAAFRVLMYLASKPDSWEVRTKDIMANLGMSEGMVKNVRAELTETGFTQTTIVRGDDGTVAGQETRLVRPLVVYAGKDAGQIHRVDFQPAGDPPVWRDSTGNDVFPGQHQRVENPPAGESTPIVSTHRVLTTEVVNTGGSGYNRCQDHGLYSLTLRACPSCPVGYEDPVWRRLRDLSQLRNSSS